MPPVDSTEWVKKEYIDKIRKMKLPVVYCSKNIDLMLKKIARELSKRR